MSVIVKQNPKKEIKCFADENSNRAYKNTQKNQSFKLDKSNAVSVGTTAIIPSFHMPKWAKFGSQGIVVKCGAAIFFLKMH